MHEAEGGRLAPDAPRQYTQSGFEVDFFVFVVCTDRGQHKRMLLTTARRELDGSHGMNNALRWFAPPDSAGELEGAGRTWSRSSYEFICPRCRRSPRIEGSKWWNLVDELDRVGQYELDLSLLPF
ncbi:hypothetical protein [Motilibacter aurantiacus]|uniref:hypothetical protein n=1 Tax=Motilibacter aurantiacus TaxID=2714955 RepID=UPI00140DD8DA|nr:hypothetical protein [Motilibacter aurantiacus]NHC44627.1 hypothetical protein [Motilibacter aurantiacus]